MARFLVAAFLLTTCSSGWWSNNSTTPEPDGPWRQWAKNRAPGTVQQMDDLHEALKDAWMTANSWVPSSWDAGLWSICDSVLGLAGWGVFGTAWGDVRHGCKRLARIVVVLGLCIAAHYIWAICWPIVSLFLAIAMTVIWVVRKVVKILGRIMFHVQRLLGGTPEAVDAEFCGPGTGKTPETSELRRFKPTTSQEKWVVLKRGKDVAVFKAGSDTQTIRSSGLYVAIEPDTMRGSAGLLDDLHGYDKVHLCRSETCNEDGQHFKVYGLARKYDPEKFELAVAAQGARDAGGFLWNWAWAGGRAVKSRLADFGSESETETQKCDAHRVRWSTDLGDVSLCVGPCTEVAKEQVTLLGEDEFHPGAVGNFCPTHTTKYVTQRFLKKCSHSGCKRLGKLSTLGMHICGQHESEASSRRSRSRSRDRRARSEDPGTQECDGDHRDTPPDVPVPGPGYQQLLEELRGMRESMSKEREPKEDEPPRRKRLASRSPGMTPKSSVHRSLAKLGMLDSPDQGDPRNWLEEFLERYSQGKELNLTEEQIRRTMAEEKGYGFSELSRVLHRLGTSEQARGQRGLTKFLSKWKMDFDEEDVQVNSPEESNLSRSWSVVQSEASSKLSTPPGLGVQSPQVAEKPGVPLTIGPPSIFGQGDRRAGAGVGTASDPMSVLAQAIQSQTAEIATLVKAQTEQSHHPPGTVKGLGRLSEEMVFVMRACDQYQVAICPGETGSSLAQALLAAQVGAATKLRAMGFRQRMTTRLAVGIAGPYWGSIDKHHLGAADFIHYTDAELDAFAVERASKNGVDQKPAPPAKLEEWMARVKRQNEVWRLCYGEEWKDVREHCADTLAGWHQECPHKWPLQVVMDAWEELHWRFMEEIKDLIRNLKKIAKRESMSLQELRFYALLPGPDGQAWLKLPNTFDIKNPEGWFKTELEPRIERRQERTLWRLTWEGGRRDRGHPAGGEPAGTASGDGGGGPKAGKTLLGPKLTAEEVNRARDRAPVDKNGTLLCWSFLTHQGCSVANCQRAHEALKGTFEQLDPCVQMQLLKRGGLRRMKAETKDTVEHKVKQLRAGIQADKSEKMSKPKRKAGETSDESKIPPPNATSDEASKAGGSQREVRFWDVPEEFEAVDYTKQEDVRELLHGPDGSWGVPVQHQGKAYKDEDLDVPERAKKLVDEERRLQEGPVL